MQKSWNKDSFLKGSSKPRKAENFHKLYKAQHEMSTRQSTEAKRRYRRCLC